MSLLEKLDQAAAARKAQLPGGIGAFGVPIEAIYSATEAQIEGRKILLFGINNKVWLSL